MTAQAEGVGNAVSGIAAVAEDNSAATEEVSASAEEMAAQAEELARTADQLRALVARFRLDATDQAGGGEILARRRAEDWAPVTPPAIGRLAR